MTGEVSNPQRRRADLRQERNREREQEPARKEEVRLWCIGKVCSCGCGQPATTAHHPTDDLYGDKWGDLGECEPYAAGCHKMRHKGYDRCPECGGWMKRGREKCSKCEGWRSQNGRRKIIRHTCLFNVGSQKCTLKGVCPYTPRKAAGCDYFKKRENVKYAGTE